MNEVETMWRDKPDEEVGEAARQLCDYTEEGERIIRAELLRRGMADPPPTRRPAHDSDSPAARPALEVTPSRPVTVWALALLAAFFMPWVQLLGVGMSGSLLS